RWLSIPSPTGLLSGDRTFCSHLRRPSQATHISFRGTSGTSCLRVHSTFYRSIPSVHAIWHSPLLALPRALCDHSWIRTDRNWCVLLVRLGRLSDKPRAGCNAIGSNSSCPH